VIPVVGWLQTCRLHVISPLRPVTNLQALAGRYLADNVHNARHMSRLWPDDSATLPSSYPLWSLKTAACKCNPDTH